MQQTENTAIVLRYANYRDNDRMLTLFSPTKGRIEALARGCRRPRSPLLAASELFALGDYTFYEKDGRNTVTGVSLIETFYPLRQDFDRLACGSYLLELTETVIQPEVPEQGLFLLLLHTLSRLTFSDQPWKPLLAGYLLHFADGCGFKPRLNHCLRCGRRLGDGETAWWDDAGGGLVCGDCRAPEERLPAVSPAQCRWMRQALSVGSAQWVETEDAKAPFILLRHYVENRLDRSIRAGKMLPSI